MMIAIILLLIVGVDRLSEARTIQLQEQRTAISEPDYDAKLLFFLNDNKLWLLKIRGNKTEEKLLIDDFVEDYEVDEDNNRLFWLDRTDRIFQRNVDVQSDDKFVLQPYPALTGIKIAFDYITEKFYMIDGESQEVDVVDLKGKNGMVLFERDPIKEEHVIREKPKKIVLDPRAGLMFILTDLNGMKNIYRCSMDGTAKKLLFSNVSSTELIADSNSRRIYWANVERKNIQSATYEGENMLNVIRRIQNPVSITVYNNQLFWTSEEGDSSIINTCKLEDNKCKEETMQKITLNEIIHKPQSLKMIKTSRRTQKTTNPCHQNNGGCQHLCLLTSTASKSSNCACNSGWESIIEDSKLCQLKKTRSKRQITWDMYSQQPTLRPNPEISQQPSHIPIHILYPGK